MRRRVCLLAFALAACSPPPRDAAWFAANPAEAQRVVDACAGGGRRTECEAARTGLSRANALARKARYRSGAS